MPSIQYNRVTHYGIVCVSCIREAVVLYLQETGGQPKSENAVYLCKLWSGNAMIVVIVYQNKSETIYSKPAFL